MALAWKKWETSDNGLVVSSDMQLSCNSGGVVNHKCHFIQSVKLKGLVSNSQDKENLNTKANFLAIKLGLDWLKPPFVTQCFNLKLIPLCLQLICNFTALKCKISLSLMFM